MLSLGGRGLFVRDSGTSSECVLISFEICGQILQTESRVWLLPSPATIRSSVSPESHSFLGFFFSFLEGSSCKEAPGLPSARVRILGTSDQ